MTNLANMAMSVETREDFVSFTRALQRDLQDRPADWTNANLVTYLEAVASWTEDFDGFFMHEKRPIPKDATWKLLAQILLAARCYE